MHVFGTYTGDHTRPGPCPLLSGTESPDWLKPGSNMRRGMYSTAVCVETPATTEGWCRRLHQSQGHKGPLLQPPSFFHLGCGDPCLQPYGLPSLGLFLAYFGVQGKGGEGKKNGVPPRLLQAWSGASPRAWSTLHVCPHSQVHVGAAPVDSTSTGRSPIAAAVAAATAT